MTRSAECTRADHRRHAEAGRHPFRGRPRPRAWDDRGLLTHDLISGEGNADDPEELLASGALVWVGNNVALSLVFWLMDGGGPIARKHLTVPVEFAFTQHINPEMGPGWRPVFLDYMHLGFTDATAFSPTDVMPLTHRAKYAMLVQATIAVALLALVLARAVNAFH